MLKDKWFHTRRPETGEIINQGYVLAYLPPRLVLVQLLSWIDGQPTIQKLWEVTDDWNFYDTNQIMIAAWEAETGRVDFARVARIKMNEA